MMAVVIAPVTPATQGADNWKVVVWGQPGQTDIQTPSQQVC
jgi:hypothetical protein